MQQAIHQDLWLRLLCYEVLLFYLFLFIFFFEVNLELEENEHLKS